MVVADATLAWVSHGLTGLAVGGAAAVRCQISKATSISQGMSGCLLVLLVQAFTLLYLADIRDDGVHIGVRKAGHRLHVAEVPVVLCGSVGDG